MTAYFLRRLLLIVPTFIGVTAVAFAITRMVPGGPAEQLVARLRGGSGGEGGPAGGPASNAEISQEVIEEFKRQLDLDKPWYEAYVRWLGKTATLNLGRSHVKHRPVWDLISERFSVSLVFGLSGFIISYLVCIPLGIAKALRHGSKFDLASSALVFVGYSIPAWALGTFMLLYLATDKGVDLFPLQGTMSQNWRQVPEAVKWIEGEEAAEEQEFDFNWDALSLPSRMIDRAWHMMLPVFCYMMAEFAVLTVLTKNSIMENLGQEYVRTAFAKGLAPRRVIFLHVLRNSLIPLATNLGHALSLLMAGSFLIETVFGIEGLGKLSIESIRERDYLVVMGTLTITTLLTLLGNIISDFLYAVTDPRIRFQ